MPWRRPYCRGSAEGKAIPDAGGQCGETNDQNPASDHVRRIGHPHVAGIARKPAQAVHSPDRRPFDLSVDRRRGRRSRGVRAGGRHHQFRLSLSRRRATEGDRRRGDDPARAGAARQRGGGRRRGRLGGGPRSEDDRRRARGRPRLRGRKAIRRALRRRRATSRRPAKSSPSASRPTIRRPATATFTRPSRWRSIRACGGSSDSSRSRTKSARARSSRTAICGTRAISSSAPTSCWRSSRASSRRSPRRPLSGGRGGEKGPRLRRSRPMRPSRGRRRPRSTTR